MVYALARWYSYPNPPRGKLNRIGVWENESFIGVVVFGHGANNDLGKPYELSNTECCELVRVALDKHQTPVSRILRIALLMVRKHNPGLKLVLSFADDSVGHHGGIYQAGNWLYLGETHAADEYIVNGKQMHGRAFRSNGGCARWPNAEKVRGSIKHRYAYVLDETIRDRVAVLTQPYPRVC